MTRLVRLRIGGLLLTACTTLFVVGLGCQGGGGEGATTASSSSTKGTVHGTVKIKGKNATKGTVTFDPSNINRKMAAPVQGDIGSDGTYSVETLIGGNQVSVSTPETHKDPKLQYNNSNLEVKSGDNTFDIEIPPPGK